MSSDPVYIVGDYIIDADQIFVVTSISDGRLYYSPVDSEGRYQSVTGSIPIQNAASSGLRKVVSPKVIDSFFKELATATPVDTILIDSKFYKDILYLNDPLKVVPLLQQLWKSKVKNDNTFSFNNRLTFDNIVNHISAEFALVNPKPSDFFRKKIISTLTG